MMQPSVRLSERVGQASYVSFYSFSLLNCGYSFYMLSILKGKQTRYF
jgi:hypothetical protein